MSIISICPLSKSAVPDAISTKLTAIAIKKYAKQKYQNSLLDALPVKLFQFFKTEMTASFIFMMYHPGKSERSIVMGMPNISLR